MAGSTTNATPAEPGSRSTLIPGARPRMEDAQPTTVHCAEPLASFATTFSQIRTNASPHHTARLNQIPAATKSPEYASAAREAARKAAHATSPAPAMRADKVSGTAVRGTTNVSVASSAAAGSCQRETGLSQT